MTRLIIGVLLGAALYGTYAPGTLASVQETNRSWCLTRKSMWTNGEGDRPDMGTIRYCGDLGVSVLH